MQAENSITDRSASLLNSIAPDLSAAAIRTQEKKTEDINTVRFVLHSYPDRILNCDLRSYRYGVRHFFLEPLTPIPIRTWEVPVIQPRARAFEVGAITKGGAFPSNNIGGVAKPELQYPSVSVAELVAAYGADATKDYGMIELDSLVSITDAEKVEAILLFRAIFETPLKEGQPVGRSLLLEDIPAFLKNDARELLERAITKGLAVSDGRFKFSSAAGSKGVRLIEQVGLSVAAVKRTALSILRDTKEDLVKAKAGQKDVKLTPDNRDILLQKHFYHESFDTEVERSTKAIGPLAEEMRALRQNASGGDEIARQSLAMMDRVIGVMEKQAGGITREDFEELRRSLQPPTTVAPSEPTTEA